ncbi:MAG: antibiotic biosynthesis monooxygenase [Marinifilaceae bacterium]|jgi:quinol monooxygenase YgiN|nr:antibiotic biosynthesis monooxygenase [Marinifilaceae bacterium]
MIIVTVKSKPIKNHKEDFIREFKNIMPIVHKEKGCIEYEIHENKSTEDELFIFEKWESQHDLDKHLETEHMTSFFKKVGDWFDSENEMNTYELK